MNGKILLIIAILLLSFSVGAKNHKRQPNIIFILTDDLGYGDVSYLNPQSKIQTPAIDRLASQGVSFTDAHSSSSVCTPSRYSVLTGRYAWRTEMKHGVLTPYEPALIEKDRETVASLLKEKGYKTACIGKWHLGMTWQTLDGNAPEKFGENIDFTKAVSQGPRSNGFDYYYGVAASLDMPPYCLMENEMLVQQPDFKYKKRGHGKKRVNPFGRPGHAIKGRGPEYFLPKLTAKTVEKIDEFSQSDQPFFIYFALTAPHTPVAPNEKFRGKSKAGEYGDFVVEVDDALDQVMNALKKNGVEENTMIVFTSDNGPEIFAYQRAEQYQHYSSGPLKGVKRDLWEGGHRVPFILRWPALAKEGYTTNQTICLADFYATIAEIVEHKRDKNEGEDSYSFYSLLKGRDKKVRPYTIHHSANGYFAIRKDDWVFIDHKTGNDNNNQHGRKYYEDRGYSLQDSEGELFNLDTDMREFNNRIGDQPQIAKELKKILEKSKTN